jgi:hypothetical protein
MVFGSYANFERKSPIAENEEWETALEADRV